MDAWGREEVCHIYHLAGTFTTWDATPKPAHPSLSGHTPFWMINSTSHHLLRLGSLLHTPFQSSQYRPKRWRRVVDGRIMSGGQCLAITSLGIDGAHRKVREGFGGSIAFQKIGHEGMELRSRH